MTRHPQLKQFMTKTFKFIKKQRQHKLQKHEKQDQIKSQQNQLEGEKEEEDKSSDCTESNNVSSVFQDNPAWSALNSVFAGESLFTRSYETSPLTPLPDYDYGLQFPVNKRKHFKHSNTDYDIKQSMLTYCRVFIVVFFM